MLLFLENFDKKEYCDGYYCNFDDKLFPKKAPSLSSKANIFIQNNIVYKRNSTVSSIWDCLESKTHRFRKYCPLYNRTSFYDQIHNN
ncbi:unnamed protein product [Adineta ricciae]|uniref:Uncharacterized protein n=1 Tax=Adineta ricciae TaxID=249248 RepID=A0A815F6W7_ADIRI|nr:unnamed protein product [Adineta ricciae]